MPRPGEFSVQRKSIRGSVRVRRGAPSSLLLSKYSPVTLSASAGTTTSVAPLAPGAGGVLHRDARAEPLLSDAVEDRHDADARSAVAAEPRLGGVGADHGDGLIAALSGRTPSFFSSTIDARAASRASAR